jgi:hypothetical protein
VRTSEGPLNQDVEIRALGRTPSPGLRDPHRITRIEAGVPVNQAFGLQLRQQAYIDAVRFG